jgi:hypothetical protein
VEAEIRPLTVKDLMRELNLNGGQLLGSILPPSQYYWFSVSLTVSLPVCVIGTGLLAKWHMASGKNEKKQEKSRSRNATADAKLRKYKSKDSQKLFPTWEGSELWECLALNGIIKS